MPDHQLTTRLDRWARTERQADVANTVLALADAAVALEAEIRSAPLGGADVTGTTPEGDDQKAIDVTAEDLVLRTMATAPVAIVGSEESTEPIVVNPQAPVSVLVDPLDGSANAGINAPLGLIFSVVATVRSERGDLDPTATVLQPGRAQLAAGVVVFGPGTVLLLTVGQGTDLYHLDPAERCFALAARGVTVPPFNQMVAINASNRRHWDPNLRRYHDHHLDGVDGPRQADANLRWYGALVAEVLRITLHGGVFLYPGDARPGYRSGRLRLLYEANPVALLITQAGGAATDGRRPILDLTPTELHQRTPLVFGSADEVETVAWYLDGPGPQAEDAPLFANRGLFWSTT